MEKILKLELTINSNSNPKKKKGEIKNDCYILIDNFYECIREIKEHLDFNSKEQDILFRVRKSLKNNLYEIINPIKQIMKKNEETIKRLNKNAWYVIKSAKDSVNENIENFGNDNEDYILNENDIIKFGDLKFEVVKKNINIKGGIKTSNINDGYNISDMNKKIGSIFDKYIILNNDEINNNNNEKCRICSESQYDMENPKLNICNCQNYIHYKCLKNILSEKIKNNKNSIIEIQLVCDKCSIIYPLQFMIKNKVYDLIDFNLISESNYIILNSLEDLKTVYIIQLNKDFITIGRKTDNDLIIDNLTISIHHAILKFDSKSGDLIIEDKSSLNGTFALIKGNIKMIEKRINFQVLNVKITSYIVNADKKDN